MSSFNPSTIAITTTTSYPRWYQGKLRSITYILFLILTSKNKMKKKAHENFLW